jgi:hypothetical protein
MARGESRRFAVVMYSIAIDRATASKVKGAGREVGGGGVHSDK